MAVGYILINNTKKETILFNHINASTALELSGNTVSSAITTWYLLKNSGDEIGFVPDHYIEDSLDWPFKNIKIKDLNNFPDVTNSIVQELIDNGILKDNGRDIFDEDEPDVYIRKLENVWGKE